MHVHSRDLIDLALRRNDRSIPLLAMEKAEAAYRVMSIDSDNLSDLDLHQAADRLVLDRYAPVGVAIDSDMTIVQFRGQTGAYLEPATGTPSFNLFKMAKPELLVGLRAAIHQSKQQHKIIRQEGLQVKIDDGVKTIEIEVIPFKIGAENKQHFLVLFQTSAIDKTSAPMPTNPGGARKSRQTEIDRENSQLKQELATTREYLLANIAEQESTNQALQVANEEILSSNEELQSINEELETSQEELQATNEELRTINEELISRNLQLGQLNNDLQNLLSSINIPILILDGKLRIRRFTALAQPIFNLISTDLGRPFSDIQPNIDIPDLRSSIQSTIDSLTTTEQEIQDRNGRWYSLRIRPYRTTDNRIDGVVIGLIDIDSLKRNATLVEASLAEKEILLREIHHRVKNNLQIVSSLLNLQSNRSTDLQVISVLQDSQNRVRAMALIHEILYQSPNLAALDFETYVQTLATNLFASNNIDRSKITLSVDVQVGIVIDVDRAVLCGLIISELVTNALKHGFIDDLCGQVAISLITNGDGFLVLSVVNNGQELPKDFGIGQIRSMGLNLVMSLVKQIKGSLELETGAMTIFKITFPLAT